MRNNTSIIYKLCLLVGDGVALIGGLSIAYILRVSISHRALTAHVHAITYLKFLLVLAPFWLFTFAILGLYTERHYQNRFSEFGRLLVGTFIGVMFVVSYSYMINRPIFPARLVVIYGFILSFVAVVIFRTLARALQRKLFSYDIGINKVLIVGDNKITENLIASLPTKITGYKIVGVVNGNRKHPENSFKFKIYDSFAEANEDIHHKQIHTIIQTQLYPSNAKNDEILSYAQSNHIAYRFVPGNSELFIGNIEVSLLQSLPIIAVHQTALVGWGRVVKRAFDILTASLALIILSPVFLLIFIFELLSGGDPILKQPRRSQFNETVGIYKFRTFKHKFNRTTVKEAFDRLGQPELFKKFLENGEKIDDDPRITKLGKFLRKTSLDELPQLINIIKGDISLVGPRALLVEDEHYQYPGEWAEKRNLLLSVPSGLTGLAQVSGRRDLSYEERRKLDLYYVQNWTFWGDIVIIIKTIWVVLFHRGAA